MVSWEEPESQTTLHGFHTVPRLSTLDFFYITEQYALLFVASLLDAGKRNPVSYAGFWESRRAQQS